MKAYLECGNCGKKTVVDGNMGKIKCPVCQSTKIARCEIGVSKPPSWFSEEQK